MSLSIKSGFRVISGWPYQYTKGRRALDANAIGAVVAADPKGFAGEPLAMGPWTGDTERAPGEAQPPFQCSS